MTSVTFINSLRDDGSKLEIEQTLFSKAFLANGKAQLDKSKENQVLSEQINSSKSIWKSKLPIN